MADELALMAARWHCLVGCLSGNTNWIKRGTVLADWYSTRTDRAAACSWPTVAGPGMSLFLPPTRPFPPDGAGMETCTRMYVLLVFLGCYDLTACIRAYFLLFLNRMQRFYVFSRWSVTVLDHSLPRSSGNAYS